MKKCFAGVLSALLLFILCGYKESTHTLMITVLNYRPIFEIVSDRINYIDVDYVISVTEKEKNMLASVIAHEVGNMSYESKVMLAVLVVNRVKDERFPDTIYEVLHAPKQFEAIHNYYDKEIPIKKEDMAAVEDALTGKRTHSAVYYCAPKYTNAATMQWFNTLELCFCLEGQNFYK